LCYVNPYQVDFMSDAVAAPQSLVIASRASRLAMWQAEFVRAQLHNYYPNCKIEIIGMTTQGDRMLDQSLVKVGGKGLFIKELEAALLAGRADLAVHSLKDVPMDLPESFKLAAILERAEPFDALVSNAYASLATMPVDSIVGTSSLRRTALMRHRFPHLNIKPLRGNLDTRLKKLDSGEYDAIILAAAGLKRLDLTARIRTMLAADESLPAAGQGALAIEILSQRQDLARFLKPLQHIRTTLAVSAERAVAKALGGSCRHPLAAYADWQNNGQLRLRAMLIVPDGSLCLQDSLQRPVADLSDTYRLADDLVQRLFAQGAEHVLKMIDKHSD
jgi:hydroxymethylbilane synthase